MRPYATVVNFCLSARVAFSYDVNEIHGERECFSQVDLD